MLTGIREGAPDLLGPKVSGYSACSMKRSKFLNGAVAKEKNTICTILTCTNIACFTEKEKKAIKAVFKIQIQSRE